MSDEDDLSQQAKDYWERVAAAASKPESRLGSNKPRQGKRKMSKPPATEQSNPTDPADPNDPLVLIVQALRENADATDRMGGESKAARLAMAEAERKMALRADNSSSEIRSLVLAVQNLTASHQTIQRMKTDRYLWAAGGAVLGVVLTAFVLVDLPTVWRHLFG